MTLKLLYLARDDMVTLEGIESVMGLRSLVSVDIFGCKVSTAAYSTYALFTPENIWNTAWNG